MMRQFTGTAGKHHHRGRHSAPRAAGAAARSRAGVVALSLLASLFIAGPAHADINVAPSTTFPTQTTLGDTDIDFNITVQNSSEDPPAGDEQRTLTLNEVGLTPACAAFDANGVCQDPEPQVFELRTGSAAATGTGGSCVGHTFDVAEDPNVPGRYIITPEQPTVLGPADGSGPESPQCTMQLRLLEVTGTPDTDVRPNEDGIQTRNGVSAQAEDPDTGRIAFGGNTKLVTVFPGQVNLETLSDPNMADGIVAPGVQATDLATITRANPEADPDPTGEVTFTLMGPDPDAACTGPVAFGPESVAIDPATGEATAGPTQPLNDPGFYNWVATYSGDNNYAAITTPVGCGDDAERFHLQPAPNIVVEKTADPLQMDAPGGDFTFFVTVTNDGPHDVEITSLVDDIYGDLNDPANPEVRNTDCAGVANPPRVRLAPGEEFNCQFDGEFLGGPGDTQTDVVTAVAEDDFGQEATDDDDATVELVLPAAPTIAVEKTADPLQRQAPGGDFTFSVEVTNTGPNAVTITSLTDDIYGDLNDPANPDVSDNTCEGAVGTPLAPNETFACEFVGEFTGDAGDTQTDVVTSTAEDEFGQEAQDDDDAVVELISVPTVVIVKTADPLSLPEPGGTFTFTVEVTNTSDRILAITSLTDDVYGDLNDPANPDVENNTCEGAVGTLLDPDETFTCTFDGEFTGVAGDTETDTVTVTGEDEFGNEVQDEDDATVEITPPPEITVDKTADPESLPEPGGTFTFTVVVTNTSDGPLTITSLTDDVYGDLNDPANPDVENNTCEGAVGTLLAPGETFTCTFDGEFTGEAGDTETDTVTVIGEDDDGREVTDEDDATVTITAPPGAPTVRIDKSADPASRPAPGGDFTFTVLVTNTSPDRAVTITSLTDDVYGDLNDPDNPDVEDNTCTDAVGTVLAASPGPGHTYTCTFVAEFTGEAGDTETDVVTVVVEDDEGREARDDDDAVITITEPPDEGVLPREEEPPPAEEPPAEEPPPARPAAQPLPRTGADVMLAVAVGLGLLLAGLMITRTAPAIATPNRRRRRSGQIRP